MVSGCDNMLNLEYFTNIYPVCCSVQRALLLLPTYECPCVFFLVLFSQMVRVMFLAKTHQCSTFWQPDLTIGFQFFVSKTKNTTHTLWGGVLQRKHHTYAPTFLAKIRLKENKNVDEESKRNKDKA